MGSKGREMKIDELIGRSPRGTKGGTAREKYETRSWTCHGLRGHCGSKDKAWQKAGEVVRL